MGDNNEGAIFQEIDFQDLGKYILEKLFERQQKPITPNTLYRCLYEFKVHPIPHVYQVYIDFTFGVEKKNDVYIRKVSLYENNLFKIFNISSDSTYNNDDLVDIKEDFDAIFQTKSEILLMKATRELLNKGSGTTEQGGASSAWHIACSSKGYTFALIG